MAIKSIDKDATACTMTVTAEFNASVDKVWQLWADPRKLERWWGPPTYPATVVDHELTPGGIVHYLMTGPEGDKHHGIWNVKTVDAPKTLEVEDRFADDNGVANPDLPATQMCVTLSQVGESTTATITSTFESKDAMDQLIAMGMEEGLREAMGQMDQLLAA